jgi:hypothetical protein
MQCGHEQPQPWWLTWSVAEVAATILPLFSQSPYLDEEVATTNIVAWCKTGVVQNG